MTAPEQTPPALDLDALERLAAEAGLPWQRWPGSRRPWMLIAAADTDVFAEVHESSETGPLAAYIVAAANALPELIRLAREAERLVHLGALRYEETEKLRALVDELRDPDPCWYDHHGHCQAHGWTRTDPKCPHARAAELFADGGEGR